MGNTTKHSSSAETFGENLKSKDFWESEAQKYEREMEQLRKPYHDGRLETAFLMLKATQLPKGASILDFGCGNAIPAIEFARQGYEVAGIDISAPLVELAKKNLTAVNLPTSGFIVGGASGLKEFKTRQFDALISLNVLAYLTNEEEQEFYREAARVLKPGGFLLVSHSNELFDVFALNRGTVEFFERNFISRTEKMADVAGLLKLGSTERAYTSYNVRENPLTYPAKLSGYGFSEIDARFFNLHPLPPALLKGEGQEMGATVVDPREIERTPKWKQMFMCSTYFSLSRRQN